MTSVRMKFLDAELEVTGDHAEFISKAVDGFVNLLVLRYPHLFRKPAQQPHPAVVENKFGYVDCPACGKNVPTTKSGHTWRHSGPDGIRHRVRVAAPNGSKETKANNPAASAASKGGAEARARSGAGAQPATSERSEDPREALMPGWCPSCQGANGEHESYCDTRQPAISDGGKPEEGLSDTAHQPASIAAGSAHVAPNAASESGH